MWIQSSTSAVKPLGYALFFFNLLSEQILWFRRAVLGGLATCTLLNILWWAAACFLNSKLFNSLWSCNQGCVCGEKHWECPGLTSRERKCKSENFKLLPPFFKCMSWRVFFNSLGATNATFTPGICGAFKNSLNMGFWMRIYHAMFTPDCC